MSDTVRAAAMSACGSLILPVTTVNSEMRSLEPVAGVMDRAYDSGSLFFSLAIVVVVCLPVIRT